MNVSKFASSAAAACLCLALLSSACNVSFLKNKAANVHGLKSNVDATSGYEDVSRAALSLLADEKFDELEQVADSAREGRTRMVGGYWKLHGIFVGLSQPNFKQNASEAEWDKHFARLNRWKALYPASPAPQIALAESWIQYGCEARGSGYADTVSNDNRRLYKERYDKAYTTLRESETLGQTWIEWHVAMLEIGLGQGWSKTKYDEAFERGFALEPTYYHLQSQKLVYLLPQWYGREGDISKFIDQNSQRIEGDEGDVMYFILVSLMQDKTRNGSFGKLAIDWQRLQSGYKAIENTYGVDRQRKNEWAYAALISSNFDAAYDAFAAVGDDWDNQVWRDRNFFDQMKEFVHRYKFSNNRSKTQQ